MTRRLDDWWPRLYAYLGRISREPLVYGQHDCALFAADAVREMTGQDFAAPYRGGYSNLRGGMRLLARDGFANHVALARSHLTPVAVAVAIPGDLAVFDTAAGVALGVVQGASVYVLHVDGVLGLVPLTDATEVLSV